jgi:hypothetical protein
MYAGTGMYTLGEAARLISVSSPQLSRWLFGYHYTKGQEDDRARVWSPPLWATELAAIWQSYSRRFGNANRHHLCVLPGRGWERERCPTYRSDIRRRGEIRKICRQVRRALAAAAALNFLFDGKQQTMCRNLGPYSDEKIAAASGLLRRFHNATVDFPLVRNRGADALAGLPVIHQ